MKIKNHFLTPCLFYPIFCITFFFQVMSYSEVLFEGYYKVSQFKKHIGLYIIKSEIDVKKNEFKNTTYLKLSKNGFNFTETLTSVSTADFKPVSYSYLALNDKKSKIIDVTFKDNMMTGFMTEDGERIKINKKIPVGTFLSSSLYYIMLRSKEGLRTGIKFEYDAIAEELAEVKHGQSTIDKKLISKGPFKLLKVQNTFAGPEYENLITEQGQNISALTPATGIESELVKHEEEALIDIKIPEGTLEKIFGQKPAGKVNILNK